jgi:translation initiation factor IF-1
LRTLDGVVVNDLRGNRFSLRMSDGRTTIVQLPGGEPDRLSRGDRVRVSGYFTSGYFTATSLSILRNR